MPRTLVAAVALALPLAATDDPAAKCKEAGHVRLVQVSSGKALSVEPAGDDQVEQGNRAVVVRYDPKDHAQQWKFEPVGTSFKVVNRKTGLVLDVSEESKAEGGAVVQWEDNGFDNQRWGWAGDGTDRRLTARHSGLAADTDRDGKLVQRTADPGSRSQLWKVVPVGQ